MPSPLKPNDIILALRDHIDPIVRAAKGHTSIANSAFEVIELLGQGPVGFRIILLWEGDSDATGQPLAGIVRHNIAVILSTQRGLRAWAGEQLHRDSPASPSLLTRLAELRTILLRAEFPPEISEERLLYMGTEPEITPEGLPLDAYRMRFTMHASIEL